MLQITLKKILGVLKLGKKKKDNWAQKQIREMAKLRGKLILM
jgi:hypothetical protein